MEIATGFFLYLSSIIPGRYKMSPLPKGGEKAARALVKAPWARRAGGIYQTLHIFFPT